MKLSLSVYSLHEAFVAGDATIDGFIEFARGVGVDAVELGYYWQDEELECAAAAKRVREAGLSVSGYIVSNNFALLDAEKGRGEIEKVKRATDRARELGTDVVRVFAGGRRGGSFEKDRARVVEALRECIAYAEPLGVRLAMEDHGGVGGTSEHLLYYHRELGSEHFGFVVDIANFLANAGEEVLPAVRRVAPHAMLVQAKDGIRQADGTWLPRLCGEGRIPLEAGLRALAEAGYDGYVSIEYEVPVDYRVGIAHEADYLRTLLVRLGGKLGAPNAPRGVSSRTKV
ncbi:MAG: sugar phosphate isomerase/epimerase family protein [Planctomycetota bacterium]